MLGVFALALQPGQQYTQSPILNPRWTLMNDHSATIGGASMADDGTIVLSLRATGPGIGDALITYPQTALTMLRFCAIPIPANFDQGSHTLRLQFLSAQVRDVTPRAI